MARGFWRGQAAQYNIFQRNLQAYLKGFGGGQFEDLLGSLIDAQMPQFRDMMGSYMGQAAGLGQAVPGQGLSGRATTGMMQTGADWMTSNVMGPALQAYQMPWTGLFGATPQASGQYISSQDWQKKPSVVSAGQASGTGTQLGSSAMGSCCFIFVEANNGVLDRIARRYRDEYGTPLQAIGYKFLACMLVPLMRKKKLVKFLVKWLMVKPMIWAGKGFYGEKPTGKIFYRLAYGWMKLFECFGRSVMKEMGKCRD